MNAPAEPIRRAAPPTVRPPTVARPSRAAPPAIALALALVGVVLPLVGAIAAALGARLLLRRDRPLATQGDRTMAIAALVLGIVGFLVSGALVAVTTLSTFMMTAQVRAIAVQQPLLALSAAFARGVRDGEPYPDHLARLLLSGRLDAGAIVGAAGPPAGDVRIGTVRIAGWTNTAEERAALEAALAELDASAPWYDLGRVRIVRLPQRFGARDLVLAWIHEPGDEQVYLLMDDGGVQVLPAADWPALWNRDAAARIRLDLPPFVPPPLAPPSPG